MQTPRFAPRNKWEGPAITRPGDQQNKRPPLPSQLRFGQRADPLAMPAVGRSESNDLSRFLPPLGRRDMPRIGGAGRGTSLPPLGWNENQRDTPRVADLPPLGRNGNNNNKRVGSGMPRFGGAGREADRDVPGFLPPLGQSISSRDMPMPPLGRDNRQPGGAGRGFAPRYDRRAGDPSARDFLPGFGRRPSERTERTPRPGRVDDARKTVEPESATLESGPAVPIRIKDVDPAYSKRQAAKSKDRGRGSRFDDSESAILDETPLSAKEAKKAKKAAKKAPKKELIPIFLPQFISVENLAAVLNVRVEKFTQQLAEMGFEQTSHDHVLGAEEAGLIAGEYGFEPVIDRGHEVDLKPRLANPAGYHPSI